MPSSGRELGRSVETYRGTPSFVSTLLFSPGLRLAQTMTSTGNVLAILNTELLFSHFERQFDSQAQEPPVTCRLYVNRAGLPGQIFLSMPPSPTTWQFQTPSKPMQQLGREVNEADEAVSRHPNLPDHRLILNDTRNRRTSAPDAELRKGGIQMDFVKPENGEQVFLII